MVYELGRGRHRVIGSILISRMILPKCSWARFLWDFVLFAGINVSSFKWDDSIEYAVLDAS